MYRKLVRVFQKVDQSVIFETSDNIAMKRQKDKTYEEDMLDMEEALFEYLFQFKKNYIIIFLAP